MSTTALCRCDEPRFYFITRFIYLFNLLLVHPKVSGFLSRYPVYLLDFCHSCFFPVAIPFLVPAIVLLWWAVNIVPSVPLCILKFQLYSILSRSYAKRSRIVSFLRSIYFVSFQQSQILSTIQLVAINHSIIICTVLNLTHS